MKLFSFLKFHIIIYISGGQNTVYYVVPFPPYNNSETNYIYLLNQFLTTMFNDIESSIQKEYLIRLTKSNKN